MTRSPIPRVLSTMRRHGVKALLMGGQACIVYGAAEFTRDIDLAVAVDPRNLRRLRAALRELRAEPVFFPDLTADVLQRGHACHFRCRAKGLLDLRIDIMSRMRGTSPFAMLWRRRTRLRLPGVGEVGVMAVGDVVQAKKTQRDKDWPMIRRLVESDYARHGGQPRPSRVSFWLREARTVEFLQELCRRWPAAARRESRKRPAILDVLGGRLKEAMRKVQAEEARERALDRRYWVPLKRELEALRLARRAKDGSADKDSR